VLEPRTVKVGLRLGERVEITEGLSPGDHIVAAGVFLIDSESRLRASGTGGGHSGHGAPPARTPAPAPESAPHSGHKG
jgi:Cu(I)/Ag(I) efflux system membrane fusion protein